MCAELVLRVGSCGQQTRQQVESGLPRLLSLQCGAGRHHQHDLSHRLQSLSTHTVIVLNLFPVLQI